MLTEWTDEALDAAISQLKALRFTAGMTAREQMQQVLWAAWNAQRMDEEIDALNNEIVAMREDLDRKIMEWRNMRSAPKNGARFLAWDNTRARPEIVFWCDRAGKYDKRSLGFVRDLYHHEGIFTEPAFWMPLPEAPDAQ